jgi:hypothetical protein
MRNLERAGMVVGAVMTGLELAREIRSAASTQALQRANRTPLRPAAFFTGAKGKAGKLGPEP